MADSRRYPLGNQLGKSVSTFLFIYFSSWFWIHLYSVLQNFSLKISVLFDDWVVYVQEKKILISRTKFVIWA